MASIVEALNSFARKARALGTCPTCGHIWESFPRCFEHYQQSAKGDVDLRITWSFHLGDLIAAAATGCRFCAFMTVRFFDAGGCQAIFSSATNSHLKNPVTCCAYDPLTTNPDSLAQHYVKLIQIGTSTDEDDSFTFHLIPRHSKGKNFPDFDKIRIELMKATMGKDTLGRLMGCRRHIVLEVFSLRGKHLPKEPLNTSQ
jgi:hypothetical protein